MAVPVSISFTNMCHVTTHNTNRLSNVIEPVKMQTRIGCCELSIVRSLGNSCTSKQRYKIKDTFQMDVINIKPNVIWLWLYQQTRHQRYEWIT